MKSLSRLIFPSIYLYTIVTYGTVVARTQGTSSKNFNTCRTRFTFSRPTNQNVLSTLFGLEDTFRQQDSDEKISFNHGDSCGYRFFLSYIVASFSFLHIAYTSNSDILFPNIDSVGITQPIIGNNDYFPSCLGYSEKIKEDLKVHQACSDDGQVKCDNSNLNGWRILRFSQRVGHGKACYKKVQNAVSDWDFEVRKGKKCMGILSAATAAKQHVDIIKPNGSGPGFTIPRKSFLATFTEICLPKPLKSVFVVNPVHVSYEVKEARLQNNLFSSTAYATLSGHLLSGEERVTVIYRKDMSDQVDVEIVSFSRAAASIGGKIIWPLIGRMQNQFFLSEMEHLNSVAKG